MARAKWMIGIALLLVLGTVPPAQAEEPKQAKNIFLMISDGLGFNGWEAAKYHQGQLPYDNDDFTFFGMTTYMKNPRDSDTEDASAGTDGAQENGAGAEQGYDKVKMWSDFDYHRGDIGGDYDITDSAAAATAMYTGTKTYGGAINYGVDGETLKTIAEYAAEQGKSTAAVSSVQFFHATPAAVDAHAESRQNTKDIASEMVHSDLDVIMGGSEDPDLEVDEWKGDARANGFAVVDLGSQWDDLAAGKNVPEKVAGIFSGKTLDGRDNLTLQKMTQGALNVLENNDNGMFMMVEGGAVDWNNHENDIKLMLREQVDFDNSVQEVMTWVDENSDWDESLLIVTSDHECGGIWGPNTVLDNNGTPNDYTDDEIADTWQNVVEGEDGIPVVQYTSGGHTNALVPVWARGAGAELLEGLVDGKDETAAEFWTQFGGSEGWDGSYIDNTDLFTVMHASSTAPEPGTLGLLSISGLLFGLW
ncbi:MAG: alkaline phosphatase [Planctomycetota bacterium]